MQRRSLVVFGADLGSDWNPTAQQQELARLLHRLDAAGCGIILLHDTRVQVAQYGAGGSCACSRRAAIT